MYLVTVFTHKKVILDESHRIAAKISLRLTGVLNLFITKDAINLTLLDQLLVNFFITHYYIIYIDHIFLNSLRFVPTHSEYAKMKKITETFHNCVAEMRSF